jgi:hypothetical protein
MIIFEKKSRPPADGNVQEAMITYACKCFPTKAHRGELEIWRAGELESWRAGELESWRLAGGAPTPHLLSPSFSFPSSHTQNENKLIGPNVLPGFENNENMLIKMCSQNLNHDGKHCFGCAQNVLPVFETRWKTLFWMCSKCAPRF